MNYRSKQFKRAYEYDLPESISCFSVFVFYTNNAIKSLELVSRGQIAAPSAIQLPAVAAAPAAAAPVAVTVTADSNMHAF